MSRYRELLALLLLVTLIVPLAACGTAPAAAPAKPAASAPSAPATAPPASAPAKPDAAAPASAPAASAQAEKPDLKVAVLPFSESLGVVIADREGYFREEGLNVELTRVNSGAEAIPLLQAGRLDIILSNTVSTLQAIEQGLDAAIIAPSAVVRAQPPDSTSAVMVVKGGPIASPKDLEGKRLATNVINSTAWMYFVAWLEKHGVDPAKVTFTEIPFPQMNDPLLNNQVAAISQVEPFRTVLDGTGRAETIGWIYVETQPNADVTQYLALQGWTRQNPVTTTRFGRAVVKGSQFANSNEAATRQINQEFTNLNPDLKDKVVLPRFGTEVNAAEMRTTMELMMKYNLLKQPVDVASRVFRAQ